MDPLTIIGLSLLGAEVASNIYSGRQDLKRAREETRIAKEKQHRDAIERAIGGNRFSHVYPILDPVDKTIPAMVGGLSRLGQSSLPAWK